MFAALTAGQFAGRRTYKKGRTDRPVPREEIRMAAASSRARISWPCATKFERPNLIWWRSHEIRSFDDHNTEAPHSAVDTGAPDGPNFAAVPRNSPVVVPENFEAPRSGPEIPECSSLRIYSRIPRSLLVIRPVIAPARNNGGFDGWRQAGFVVEPLQVESQPEVTAR